MSINRALCDLCSCVSLIPYSIFNKLDLRAFKPTTIILQLGNSVVKYPLGILEDVPIKVGEFYMLVDFVIFFMAKDVCTQIIPFMKPFLATAGCKIDAKGG